MTKRMEYRPVPESSEYDLITYAIKHGGIGQEYRICRAVEVEAGPVVPVEVRQAINELVNFNPYHIAARKVMAWLSTIQEGESNE